MRKNTLHKLALVGYGISKSKSPALYRHLLGQTIQYDLIDCNELSSTMIYQLLDQYDGINITAPFKNEAASCADRLVGIAEKLKLANCLVKKDGVIIGANSDWIAASDLFQKFSKKYSFERVVIIGDGAMANLFKSLFEKIDQPFESYSRKNNNDFYIKDYSLTTMKTLIINTCLRSYLFKNTINNRTLFWDLNYSNDDQRSQIENQSGIYYDGFQFLIRQGYTAIEFWRDPIGYSTYK